MKGEEFILNFEDDKAFLTKEKALTFKQLNLPPVATRFKEPASWILRVLNYIPAEKKIFAEIVSYNTGGSSFPDNQLTHKDALNNVEIITFRSIDTNGLLRTLAGNNERISIYPTNEVAPFREQVDLPTAIKVKVEPKITLLRETFSVPLKNIVFKFGCVSFDKRIDRLNRILEFTILNDELRPEFDAVKNYFANALEAKKIIVDVEIHLKDDEITSIVTKSPEIDRIDKKLIEGVRFEFVKTIANKNVRTEIDKSLFTMDEFFDTLTDGQIKANTFYTSDNDLFEDLLHISNTKHYKHLRFLSSKHLHSVVKLRFVIKPFSFVFLLDGEKHYYIIWETLDTEEATYIWCIDKDMDKLKIALDRIENIISSIKVQGKITYISSAEDNFKRIYHDYSEVVEGFVKWKGELENILT